MMASVPGSSHRRVCGVLEVSRASADAAIREPTSRRKRPVNKFLAERIRNLIQRFSTFGYRRLWAWLYFREGIGIHKKAVC